LKSNFEKGLNSFEVLRSFSVVDLNDFVQIYEAVMQKPKDNVLKVKLSLISTLEVNYLLVEMPM
jgi:hypothetical protein